MAGAISELIAVLANGLIDESGDISPEIVVGWLASHLPTRDYELNTPAPTPISLDTDAPARAATSDKTGAVHFFDLVDHMSSGATTTSSNVRADGSTTTVTTDGGGDTFAQLREACHGAASFATELQTTRIYGSSLPQNTIVDTLARLMVVLLFEPVRFVVQFEYCHPVTSEVENTVASAAREIANAQSGRQLAVDQLMQNYLLSASVNWFEGVAELGIAPRFLRASVLETFASLISRAGELFNPASCRIDTLHTNLAGFRHNRRISDAFDRGRLLGAVCRSFVRLNGAARAEFARETCRAALDRAALLAYEIAGTPRGALFATRAKTEAACAVARQALHDLDLARSESTFQPQTRSDVYRHVVNTLQARY